MAQNQYEVEIKLGLDKSTQLLDREIEKIDKTLTDKMSKLNKQFEESIKGQNLTAQERFARRSDFLQKNNSSTQSLQSQKETLLSKKAQISKMSGEISNIGSVNSQFDTIGKYLAERVDFIKQLDSWIGQYTKQITEFKPVIIAAEQQKAYQQKIKKEREKAAKTGKVDYKAETMAKRNLTEEQYNKEIDAMSKYYEANAKTNQAEEDKITRQKEARFAEEMKRIVTQQKKSKMSDTEFEKRRPQIEKDVRAYVDKTHAGGTRTLAGSDKWGRKIEVRGFQEGFVKDSDDRYVDAKGRVVKGTDTSVLRTTAFAPFINKEGEYVSATNSEGRLKKSIRVYDPRLANIGNVGRVGDLRNQTYTGIENAYNSLLNQLKDLKAGGKQGTEEYQKISQLASLIPEVVKDAYTNTSSKEIKAAFEEALTGMKSGITALESEKSSIGGALYKNSELSSILREQLKLKGKVSKIQRWEVGELPEAPTQNKTDRTDERQIKRDQISAKQQEVIDQKHKDELWHSIEGAKESTYDDKGELLEKGIKDFLAGLSGDKEQLHQAVLALVEQIVQTAGVDIDAKQQMNEVISQQSINVPIKYKGEERDSTLESAITGTSSAKYQAVLEEQRSKMAGGLSEGFQRIQSALAFQQTGTAGDEAVKQAIERINWLADIVSEIGGNSELEEGLRKIAEGNPRFTRMDANTIANSISKIYAFSEGMDASLSHNLNNLNQARQAQGLKPIKEEKYREKFFKENPEIAQKYEESKAARERYDSVESDKVSDKLQAFFSVVGQTEEGVNKFITVLAKAYENLNGTISKVVKTDEGDRRVTASAQRWVEDTVEYRVSSSGNALNPNKGVNAPYYQREGIRGQDVNWEEITSNPSPALTTNLQNKAGLTGNIYGGNSPQENAEIAKSILEKKKKELARVQALVVNPKSEASKNKNLKRIQEIQAEIDFHYKNWDELVMAQTPVVRKGKKNTEKNDFEVPVVTPVNPEAERIKNLKESVKQSGFSQGASFTAKNSVRRTFGGTITGIKGEGARQVVEALLEDGKTVKYTFDSLLKQLVTYSEQAATTVGDTSEQIKADVVQDVQQIEQATDSTIESKNPKPATVVTKEATQTGNALQQEEVAITDVNAALDKHETEVLSAADAEQQKILVSQDLVKQLAKEEGALDKVSESAKEAEIQKGVTYTYKNLQSYDDATHTYTDTNGNKLRSITQLGGALKGFIPSATAIADEKAFMAAIASTPKGEQLTAEKIGMTAQDFAKKKNAIISREKGNLEHEVFDLLSKTGFSGVEGFAGKDVEVKWNGTTEVVDAQEQFARVLKEKADLLSKLGIDNAEQLLLQAVESYTKAINNAHIQLTPFSETPMAASFSGPKGTFDYSFTPDQIARSSEGSPQNFILDTKTGKTYGTESFQLAGQLYGVLANAQNPEFQKLYQESGIDTDKDFSLFIADVKDGFTQLIQHMALTEEEFYDLLARANDIIDGNAEPLTKDEQATLMNREMTTGRIFGRSESPVSEKAVNNNFVSYAPDENGSIDKREQAIINAYVGEYQRLIALQTELNNLQEQKNTLAQDGVNFTEDESNALNKQIEKQKEAIQAQIDLMSERELTLSNVNDNSAIGKTILSTKGNEDLQAKLKRIETKGEVKEAKNISSVTTAVNTSQTKDLSQMLKQYTELLDLRNKLKDSDLKAEGLTGDKQTAQQKLSQTLREQIESLEQILTINGQIVDSKTLEEEITKATYLTESERKEKLDALRKATNEAARTSATTDVKYAQAARNNNPTLQNTLTGYYRNLEEQGRIEREIARAENKGMSLTGNAAIENKSFIHSLQSQKNNLANQYKYDEQKKTLNGIELTEEQINKLEQERTRILNNNQIEMDRVGNSVNQTKGFLTQLKDNFKDSFSQIGMAIMQIFSFQQIQKVFNDFISATERLDQKMVDLQIASGYTKNNIHDMMLEFNDLAKEIGKTTEEIAEAANDWLRAGYEGQEASQLTEASMQLSTLGMISSADATSYLISVLKGWKLEATEIQGVVDRLSAVDMAAAISAGDLAEAMSRASNSAQMAGTSLDRYIAYLTTITDVTQKSAASVGESMKTVYARYQNIAAGKFVAAESDIESENYNADEWANLNDVEKALGALGINIRDSVSSFRDFDDIMDEIASKWNTYTDVQKSGIATSLAGVRQRENLLTLFENWDAVEKFEEISTNAYGTAVEKMKSYTDSVEAAKNRITVALEKWVLALNQSDTLIWFYNAVAEVSDNLVAWAGAILLATAAMNSVGFGSAMQNAWSKFVSSCINVSMKLDKMDISTQGYFTQGGRQSLGESLKANYTESFNVALKENYAKSLTNTINSLDNLTDSTKKILVDGYVPMQNSMLNYNDKIKANIASILKNTEVTDAQAALQLQENLADQNNAWVDAMLSTIDQEELRLRTEQITQGLRSLTNEEKLQIATEELARRRNDAAVRTIADDLEGASRTSPQRAALKGGATMVGSGLGALAGAAIGENLLGGGWATSLGTMIGMGIGGKATSTIALTFVDSMKAGGSIFTAMKALPATLGPALGIGIAALAIGAAYALYKKHQQKMIEEAKTAFTDAAEELTNAKSLQATAQKYDELSKGVDSLGRNVSLTDEEYEKFLDYSNQLVEAFPELRVRTDENGNAIADMGNEMETTSDKVKGLIDSLQTLADQRMVMGSDGEKVLQDTLDTAAQEYKDALSDLNNARADRANNYTDVTALQQQRDQAQEELDKAREDYNDAEIKQLQDELINAQNKLAGYQQRQANGEKNLGSVIVLAQDNVDRAKRAYENKVGHQDINTLENQVADLDVKIKEAQAENNAGEAAVDAAQNAYDRAIISAKETLSESGKAYARLIGAYEDVDDVTSNLFDNAIGSIDAVDKAGNALSPEMYKQKVRDMINSVNGLVSDETVKTLIEATDEKINTDMTVADANKARTQLKKYLEDTFPNIEDDENLMKIVVGIGFEVVDGEIVDKQNIAQQFKDKYGFSKQPRGITEDYFNSLTVSQGQKLFNWMGTDGYFSNGVNTNQSIVNSMFYADRETPTKLTGENGLINKYLEDMNAMNDLEAKIDEVFNGDKYDLKNSNLNELFAEFPETVRNSLSQVQEALNNGDIDKNGLADQLRATYDNAYSTVLDEGKKIAETMSSQYFSDLELPDGYIKSWSELKEAFSDVSSIFDQLADAREEMASSGRLSIETTLELLSTNADYINALEIEGENIVLKTDAEEIMNKVRLQTIAVSLQAQIQEDNLRVAQLKNQLQTLMLSGTYIETSDALVESTKAKVYAYDSEGEALANLANQYLTAANAASLLNRAQNGETVDIGSVKAVKTIKYTPTDKSALESKTIDLSGNTEALQKQIEVTKSELKSLVGSFDEVVTTDKTGKVTGYDVKFKTHTDKDGNIHYDEGNIAMREHLLYSVQDMLESGNLAKAFKKGYTKPIKSAGKAAKDTKDKVLDLLKAYDSLIDKEWEAMKVFDENTLTPTGYTQYFEKKRASLEKLAAYYEGMMQNTNLTEEERLDAEKNYIENQKAINNLDDEEVEDKYKILELYGASINSLILMKQQLVKTSDTYEELLENQKDLNSLLQDEIDLRKEVSEWQQKLSDRELNYVKGSAWSNSSAYDAAMNASLAEIEKQIEATKASIQFNFSQAVYGYMTEGMSEMEARAHVAFGNSDYSKAYREAQQEYLDLIDSKTEYVVNRTSAQIEELSNKLQLLEDSKPQEWIRISDIESYYASRSTLLQNQVSVYQKALEDVSDLTDEQIKDLVDGLNEATVALHEAKINALEDKTELQEKQYDAIVYRINLYKDELQDAIDAIEQAYEDEIKPLEDANKERERAIELENLLLAKKNANKEKERVYRQGIGWVYESNPTKLKEAQKDLDDFYKQDRLDDLNNTKDAEQQILQDRIDAWDKYLEQLEWDYKEYERLENERILKELMNANSEEEIRARITADMQKFNSNVQQNYKNYTTIFQDNLLTPYRQANEQLAELRRQRLELLDTSDFYNKNNNQNGYIKEDDLNTYDFSDLDMNTDYAAKMLAARNEGEFKRWAAYRDEKARRMGITIDGSGYGYDKAGNKFRYQSNDELYQQWLSGQGRNNSSNSTPNRVTSSSSNSSGSSNRNNSSNSSSGSKKNTSTIVKPSQGGSVSSSSYGGSDIGKAMLNAKTSEEFWRLADQRTAKIKQAKANKIDTSGWPTNQQLYDQWLKLHPNTNKSGFTVTPYATGIEEGPVTYTGLAMLHGTPSKPEYVLNSDQAYNLLRNMATTRLPEMERTGTDNNCGTQYIVQGDVVLEGVNDPAKFWSGVTTAMGSRWNVTRKTRG